MPEQSVIAEFKECPYCKEQGKVSTETLGGTLLRIVKEQGKVSDDFQWSPIMTQLQPPIDPTKPPLIGSTLPSAIILTDWCLDCGRTYTVKIIAMQAQIMDAKANLQGMPFQFKRNDGGKNP